MPVTIETKTDLSLADLVSLKAQGFKIEETPHIGNLAMSTMALMSLGISPNLVDVNIGSKDNLFYPHSIIKGGVKTIIAPADVMSTHNKVSGSKMSLCEFHTAPLKQIGFNAECHSQWIAERREEVHQILQATYVGRYQMLWRRYVKANGLAEHEASYNTNILDKVHKVNVPANGSGWVIPNPINILLDMVLGAKDTGKDVVYMLSGQSMYKYITKNYDHYGKMSMLISELYDLVVKSGFAGIPKNLKVFMVPIPVLRHFAVPNKHKDLLDAKLKYVEKVKTASTRCGIKCADRTLGVETKKYLAGKRGGYLRKLSARTSHFSAQSETGIFYTQHDLAEDEDSIYIPGSVMEITISKMVVIVENLQKFSNKKERA